MEPRQTRAQIRCEEETTEAASILLLLSSPLENVQMLPEAWDHVKPIPLTRTKRIDRRVRKREQSDDDSA